MFLYSDNKTRKLSSSNLLLCIDNNNKKKNNAFQAKKVTNWSTLEKAARMKLCVKSALQSTPLPTKLQFAQTYKYDTLQLVGPNQFVVG